MAFVGLLVLPISRFWSLLFGIQDCSVTYRHGSRRALLGSHDTPPARKDC